MDERDQLIKGFGAALSNSASYLIYNSPQRATIIQDLFDPVNGILNHILSLACYMNCYKTNVKSIKITLNPKFKYL